jgi:hypothetical protein
MKAGTHFPGQTKGHSNKVSVDLISVTQRRHPHLLILLTQTFSLLTAEVQRIQEKVHSLQQEIEVLHMRATRYQL